MMHMTFYWGRKVTILFDSWRTETWTAYALSLLVCFLFAVFYQYLEDRRIRFRLISSSTSKSPPPSTAETPLLYRKLTAGGRWNPAKFAGAILFGVNSALGYCLMLAIMSFNGGVFIAIVVGLAVGYLLFRSSDDDVVVVDNPCACA